MFKMTRGLFGQLYENIDDKESTVLLYSICIPHQQKDINYFYFKERPFLIQFQF